EFSHWNLVHSRQFFHVLETGLPALWRERRSVLDGSVDEAGIAIPLRPVHDEGLGFFDPAVDVRHTNAVLLQHFHYLHFVLEAVELRAGTITLDQQGLVDTVLLVLDPPHGTPAHKAFDAGDFPPNLLLDPGPNIG